MEIPKGFCIKLYRLHLHFHERCHKRDFVYGNYPGICLFWGLCGKRVSLMWDVLIENCYKKELPWGGW